RPQGRGRAQFRSQDRLRARRQLTSTGWALKEHERDCFLGVSRSLGGRRWIERRHDSGIALALAQRLALPEIVGRVLAGRGVSPDRADAFLSPRLRDLL